MNFLANIYLWLLPLVSVPLLIYLFNKSSYRNYEYSSIKFLTSINKKSIKKINLLNILLLIIRTLIILFFIFMMTRPFYNRSFKSDKDADGYALIVIDNSLTMHNNIDKKIKKTLASIISPLNERVKIDIIASDNLSTIYSGYKKNIELTNIFIPKSFHRSSLNEVFSYASSTDESTLNKYLFIISDGQVDSNSKESYTSFNLQDWIINYINLGHDMYNVAVGEVSSSSNFVLLNNKFTIDAEILNKGSELVQNHLVELYVNDINVGKKYIDLDKNEKVKTSFNVSLPKEGDYKCYIKCQKDDFSEDNVFYFKINVVSALDIDIINESENIFLANILSSFNLSTNLINSRKFTLNGYLDEEINNNILFIIGLQNFNSKLLSKLESIPKSKQFKVIVFPNLTDTSFNSFSNISGNIDNNRFSVTSLEGNNYIEIDYNNINDKFIKNIFSNNEKRNIKVFNYINLNITNETLIGLNNNKFLLNRYIDKNLEFLLFSISLDLQSSNLPIKGSVIPLFKTLLSLDNVIDFISITDNIGINSKILNSEITTPNGQKFTLYGSTESNHLNNVGFYNYLNKNENSFFAVNYDSLELKLKHITNNKVLATYLPNQSRIIDNEEEIQNILSNNIIGYEIWTYFLFMVLILILLEMYLSILGIKNE